MRQSVPDIHIIGGGISGLIAATVLEQHGFLPTIIEASDRLGGRVKTDIIDGYSLDRGFQVLLTAYPAAKKYLDFDALSLQEFLPGAAIFKNGKQKIIFRDKEDPNSRVYDVYLVESYKKYNASEDLDDTVICKCEIF